MRKYDFTESWYTNLEISLELIKYDSAWNFYTKAKRVAVEIGVFEGMSSALISDNLLDNKDSILISIDHFKGSEEHKNKKRFPELSLIEERARHNISISKNASKCRILKKPSCAAFEELRHEFGKRPWIDFIYIDGSHSFEDLQDDICKYIPCVKKGGIVIFDDYHPRWTGVKKAVDEVLPKVAEVECIEPLIPQFVCRIL